MKTSRIGALVERRVADRYDLELEGRHRSWADATFQNGTPVEIKAAAYRRSSGAAGRFRVFRDPHRQLVDRDGWYAFAVYRIRGRGVEVVEQRMRRAVDLEPVEWYGAGGHRDSEQVKLPTSRVFG
jgi:hypothetical protein